MKKIGERINEFLHWVAPSRKYVYYFNEGSADEKELLGKKGSNLCEMFRLGLPIPHGFIISSEASSDFFKHGAKELSKELTEEINKAVREIELETGKYFGMQPLDSFPKKTDRPVPLLLSVRADSSVTVPGIMPSILNLGLNDSIVGTMFKSSNNGRWVYDTYRRFLQSFGTIVFDVPAERYEAALNALLERKGMKSESYLGVAELVELVSIYKGIHPVPEDPWLQLGMAIAKVMRSWWSDRAVNYRDIHNIAEDVSVNIVIQSMVYGNRNVFSGSGIAYSRNPVTGEQGICGDYLPNSEGDDVLSGMRTPMPLMDLFREQPVLFEKLANICSILEKHFQDVQAIEFTIDSGYLYLLETREAFRTSEAAAHFAVSFVNEGIISERAALMRVDANFMRNYLHTTIDRRGAFKGETKISGNLLGTGTSGSFGAITGYLAFNTTQIEALTSESKPCILYRKYAVIDDSIDYSAICGMVTSKGGSTSALCTLLRGLGKELVVGASDIIFDEEKNELRQVEGDIVVREGDLITIDGSTGLIYAGDIPLRPAEMTKDFETLMNWADRFGKIGVMAEVSTREEAVSALHANAAGVGLCRLENLLKEKSCIDIIRQILLKDSDEEKRELSKALVARLQSTIFDLFKVVGNGPFIFQLIDCSLGSFFPLHLSDEFKPSLEAIASQCGITYAECHSRVREFIELNPLLGFRGARIAIVDNLLLEVQVAAVTGAMIQAVMNEIRVECTIMIPTIFSDLEVARVVESVNRIKENVCHEYNVDVNNISIDCGAIISTPRACLRANKIARLEDVTTICFDTDLLTQLMLGVSQDDAHKFMDTYVTDHIVGRNPFKFLDTKSVGSMICLAMSRIKEANSSIRVGVIGSHCNDPQSVNFLHREHLDYIVCHASLVSAMKIAAAQSRIREYNDSRKSRFRPDISPMWPMYSVYPGIM